MSTLALRGLLACAVFALTPLAYAAEGFTVEIDTTKAPECAAFAEKSKAIVEEWYPKIDALLFGAGHPLPARIVRLWFEPMKGVAHAGGDHIHISAEWVSKKAPNDYGMVVHELTHVVQHYGGKGEFWLTEGIADWVRYEKYEPGQQKWKLDPQKSSYKQGYGIAGAFLGWLETKKHAGLVRELNIAIKAGQYRPELFQELCGADLDTLWAEFVSPRR